MASSTQIASLISTWVGNATDFLLVTLAGLVTFAIGYAVAKGSLRFVLKRLHIIA